MISFHSKLGIGLGVGAGLLILSLSMNPPAGGQDKNAATYKTKCAVCHGATGKGDTPAGKTMGATDLSKAAATKSDAELKSVIENGRNKMPAYGKSLKPAEIDGLVAYLKSLK
jgi:cytochrome c6